MPTELVLGVDVGGTQTTVAIGTAEGSILSARTGPSHADRGFPAMWSALTSAIRRELDAVPTRPSAIGVSIGGPVSSRDGVVYSPPNLPGWDAIPLVRLLQEEFSLPVFIEHDAKAGALAEWMFGAGRGQRNLIFLTLGTGLGAGLIIDGRLCHGRRNNIGEVGHWRMAEEGPDLYGKPGSWEGFSSGAGLAAAAAIAKPAWWRPGATAATVFGYARSGDPAAVDLVAEFALRLGHGVALLVDLLAPESVILGSLAVRAGDLFLPQVQRIVDSECTDRNLPCPVVPAALGDSLGTAAALAVAVAGGSQS